MTETETLYHYCTNETFCSIVNGGAVWLSSLSLSNDTMEGKWVRKLFKAECERSDIPRRDLESILSSFDFLVDTCDGLGFCLSEGGDMLSQWRGYAADGQGVCIGFRKKYLLEGQRAVEEKSGYSLIQVKYDELSDADTVSKVIQRLKVASTEGVLSVPGLLLAPADETGWIEWRKRNVAAKMWILLLMGELFSVKNPAFCEEREWRLLSLDVKATSEISFRARGDSVVPYRVFQLDIERNPISSVTLGPRNKSKESDVERFLKAKGHNDFVVLRSSASYR